jgi:hypothetical protein
VILYLDTSSLVKIFVEEDGSQEVRVLVEEDVGLHLGGRLSGIEERVRGGPLSADIGERTGSASARRSRGMGVRVRTREAKRAVRYPPL